MGKLGFGTEAAINLAGIGGGAALNAYLGKKEAEKYGLTPEEKQKLMIRRGLKGAALGALGTSLVTTPIIYSRAGRFVEKNGVRNAIKEYDPSALEYASNIAGGAALLGGIAGRFYGGDVRKKIDYAKQAMKYKDFNPETGRYETKGQSRMFAGGVANSIANLNKKGVSKGLSFGQKAANWWLKRSNAEKGAMIGAVGGAAVGAYKKGVKGALVGAAGGAAVGAGAGMAYGKWGKGALKDVGGLKYTHTHDQKHEGIATVQKEFGKEGAKNYMNNLAKTSQGTKLEGGGVHHDYGSMSSLSNNQQHLNYAGKVKQGTQSERALKGFEMKTARSKMKDLTNQGASVAEKGTKHLIGGKEVTIGGGGYIEGTRSKVFLKDGKVAGVVSLSDYFDYIPTKMFSRFTPVVKKYY